MCYLYLYPYYGFLKNEITMPYKNFVDRNRISLCRITRIWDNWLQIMNGLCGRLYIFMTEGPSFCKILSGNASGKGSGMFLT